MKKIMLVLFISIISLSADYKLVLTDVDGNQTNECVKSYSFSNNLESIANQTGVNKEVYSDEEVMTNKIYRGKPVYRKLVTIPSNLIADHKWRAAPYINPAKNIETLISARQIGVEHLGATSHRGDLYDMYYVFYATQMGYLLGSARPANFNGAKVALEYTKTTDVVNSTPNKFQSYLHYKLSSSTTDEVITKDMENLGVQLLKGYSYDATTNSCTKN
ncbi:hypothetical protein [Arcobacter sp.]|uniref:hypothetical protein n=1 Tax=Arcobacter sp. TaxID=1872629 RepID=UPI003D14FB8D